MQGKLENAISNLFLQVSTSQLLVVIGIIPMYLTYFKHCSYIISLFKKHLQSNLANSQSFSHFFANKILNNQIFFSLQARTIFEAKFIQFLIFSFSYWQVCVSTIGGSCCVFSLTPVFFEYTAELTYPLSEGLSGGWLTLFYNSFATVVFACSEENKYIGVIWIDWVLFVSCLGKIFRLSQPYLTLL